MKVKNKIEIDLSVEDIKEILYAKLRTIYPGDYSFDFKVINKPYPCGVDLHESCDRYEFDTLKIVVVST